jgi:glycosyltransferase involved in cell wall biosynthesis
MLSHLISQGWDSHKLKHISYHVNPSNFPLSSPHHSPKHFLSVGRLVEKKGGILTLVAFHQVLQKHPDATLTIIGDGPFGEIYRQYCRGVGLLDSVNFLGAQPHEVVAKEMAKARCFVQHSVTSENNDHEGTPVAIIEAQVSGLPVVATTHAGIPEAVIDGKTGFLVEEFDVDSMAARMSDFAANTYLAESFGKEARNSAVERFSFENTIGRIAKLACEVSRK